MRKSKIAREMKKMKKQERLDMERNLLDAYYEEMRQERMMNKLHEEEAPLLDVETPNTISESGDADE